METCWRDWRRRCFCEVSRGQGLLFPREITWLSFFPFPRPQCLSFTCCFSTTENTVIEVNEFSVFYCFFFSQKQTRKMPWLKLILNHSKFSHFDHLLVPETNLSSRRPPAHPGHGNFHPRGLAQVDHGRSSGEFGPHRGQASGMGLM